MSPQIMAAVLTTTASPDKKKKSSLFSLKCGCSNAKSVSVSTSHTTGSQRTTTPTSAASLSGRHHPHTLSARFESLSADTITLTSTSHDDDDNEDDGSPSFSGLLRQLSELERSVIAWDRRCQIPSAWAESNETGETWEVQETHHRTHVAAGDKTGGGKPSKDHRRPRQKQGRHRRSQSEGGGGGDVMGKMEGSVVVVTETEDPLGEFRRSMLQMIVEEDMVCPEELRELLRRFLALNSPSQHALIVRAFADIWHDVFSGHLDEVPDQVPTAVLHPHLRHRRQYSYHGHHCY